MGCSFPDGPWTTPGPKGTVQSKRINRMGHLGRTYDSCLPANVTPCQPSLLRSYAHLPSGFSVKRVWLSLSRELSFSEAHFRIPGLLQCKVGFYSSATLAWRFTGFG